MQETSSSPGWWAKLPLAHKLAAMAGLLIAGILYFASVSLLQTVAAVREMQDVAGISRVAVAAGALVHEIQKERGMSGGFIGSKGQTLKAELGEQRKLTDERLAALQQELSATDLALSQSGVGKGIAAAAERAKAAQGLRAAVDRLSISAPDALASYTEAIAQLLAATGQLSSLSTDTAAMQMSLAYSSLLLAKENAGQERAILVNAFAADRFDDGVHEKLLLRIAAQQIHADTFLALARDDQQAYYRKTLAGPAVEAVMNLRRVALDKAAAGQFGIDSSRWFKTATERIDLFKQVEDRVAADLLAYVQTQRAVARNAIAVALGSVLLVVGCGAGLAWFVARGITRQLGGEPSYVVDVVRGIAQGDLTAQVEVRSNDQRSLLHAMAHMQSELRKTVRSIQTASSSIGTASREIASGNSELSARTEAQAASLEETAASMEELTGTVKQNADNAHEASQLAAGASSVAVKGGEVVAQVVHTMSAINESSRKIADIISVVDGIAFQTNILALNAAVEAARAGEHGRGFAVVAAEVRMLAQRSAAAAKEIEKLITESVHKVDSGTKLVDEAGRTMGEIVAAVQRVTDIMAAISSASQEQSSGIDQVNRAVTQMDQVTQQNAALVEEASAAAQSMREQAGALVQAVSVFKVNGAAGRPPVDAGPRTAPASRSTASSPAVARIPPVRPERTAKTSAADAVPAGTKDEWAEF